MGILGEKIRQAAQIVSLSIKQNSRKCACLIAEACGRCYYVLGKQKTRITPWRGASKYPLKVRRFLQFPICIFPECGKKFRRKTDYPSVAQEENATNFLICITFPENKTKQERLSILCPTSAKEDTEVGRLKSFLTMSRTKH